MRVHAVTALLTTTAALTLTACSGDGSGMSRADYVRKGNAVCADQRRAVDAIETPNVDVQSNDLTRAQLAEVAAFFDTGARIQHATVAKLRALGYPKGDRATLTKIYDEADRGADSIQQAANAARAGDLARMRSALDTGTTDLDAAQHAVNAYGLDKCGSA